VTAAQKMTDVSLYIFRSKFEKTRIQMIDDSLELCSKARFLKG